MRHLKTLGGELVLCQHPSPASLDFGSAGSAIVQTARQYDRQCPPPEMARDGLEENISRWTHRIDALGLLQRKPAGLGHDHMVIWGRDINRSAAQLIALSGPPDAQLGETFLDASLRTALIAARLGRSILSPSSHTVQS